MDINDEAINLIIVSGGLNQIYTNHSQKFCDYKQILDYILNLAVKDGFINLDTGKIILDYFKNSNEKFKINNAEIDNHMNLIFGYLSPILFEDFYFTEKGIFSAIISQKIKIVLLHKNYLDSYVDNLILIHGSPYRDCFTIKCQDENFIDEITKKPKEYLVFSSDLTNLLIFHQLEAWTVYLTHYLFTNLHSADKDQYKLIHNINEENKQVLKHKGKFVTFSTPIFYQLRNYYRIIIECNNELESNNSDEKKLKEKIEIIKPIRVLTFYKTHFKKGELRKSDHYTSNEKVLFISHVGGASSSSEDEISLEINGDFDALLFKFSEKEEIKNYSDLFNKFEDYQKSHPDIMSLNSCRNIFNVMNRESMTRIIKNFCQSEEVKNLNDKFKNNIIVPRCYSVNLKEVYDLDSLESFFKEKSLSLPVIIKYSGPVSAFNHLLVTLITEEGKRNYIDFIQSFTKGYEDDVSMVIQSYVNHGGYVMKLYRINQNGRIFLRPSLPDVSEEFTKKHEEYREGFFKIFTSDLLGQEYSQFWSKLTNTSKVDRLIDKTYLQQISDLFEKYVEMTLFGLDFLYDIDRKEYNLVDVNFYPGYKEMVKDFNAELIEHVVKYYKKFKQTGKIFE